MDNAKAEKTGTDTNKVRSYIALALVGLAAVLLVAWLVSGDDDDSSATDSGAATIVSAEELEDAVADDAEPVYWAGEQEGAELELSRPEEGRTFVRYLTDGADAGDPRAEFLTVGTYVQPEAVKALRGQAKEANGVLGTAPGKGVVYFNRDQPASVYLAYPGVDVQIEVFDPSFTRALQLVNSGQIVPVG
ncbi:MAG TPA: hypothetical protein VFY48_01090 [Solirubrobacterales bacterium]|nr:hypothetical protein [Solirubrobacterales bacterium]